MININNAFDVTGRCVDSTTKLISSEVVGTIVWIVVAILTLAKSGSFMCKVLADHLAISFVKIMEL